jgi:hypothetical protein
MKKRVSVGLLGAPVRSVPSYQFTLERLSGSGLDDAGVVSAFLDGALKEPALLGAFACDLHDKGYLSSRISNRILKAVLVSDGTEAKRRLNEFAELALPIDMRLCALTSFADLGSHGRQFVLGRPELRDQNLCLMASTRCMGESDLLSILDYATEHRVMSGAFARAVVKSSVVTEAAIDSLVDSAVGNGRLSQAVALAVVESLVSSAQALGKCFSETSRQGSFEMPVLVAFIENPKTAAYHYYEAFCEVAKFMPREEGVPDEKSRSGMTPVEKWCLSVFDLCIGDYSSASFDRAHKVVSYLSGKDVGGALPSEFAHHLGQFLFRDPLQFKSLCGVFLKTGYRETARGRTAYAGLVGSYLRQHTGYGGRLEVSGFERLVNPISDPCFVSEHGGLAIGMANRLMESSLRTVGRLLQEDVAGFVTALQVFSTRDAADESGKKTGEELLASFVGQSIRGGAELKKVSRDRLVMLVSNDGFRACFSELTTLCVGRLVRAGFRSSAKFRSLPVVQRRFFR